MSGLKVVLTISIAMLAAGVGDAQAAKIRFPFSDFNLFNYPGAPEQLTDQGRRIPAIQLGDDQDDDGDKPAIKPDNSRSWSSEKADKPENGDWSSEHVDQPDSDWQATTTTRSDPVWTMQTATP